MDAHPSQDEQYHNISLTLNLLRKVNVTVWVLSFVNFSVTKRVSWVTRLKELGLKGLKKSQESKAMYRNPKGRLKLQKCLINLQFY